MKTENLRIIVSDLETFHDIFLYYGYVPATNEKIQYEISSRKNEVDALVKHLIEFKYDYMATFNGVNFDNQVLQYIMDNHDRWYDKTWKEVVTLIAQFAQEIISNQDYELKPPYREDYMDIKQIDIFKILHYDNQSRRCSLKYAGEFSLDGDIEELPMDHTKENLTSEEIDQVIEYCWNDVVATYNLYKVIIGDTNHPEYKGKNKVQLRLDLIEEMELPAIAINWNDVKIGDELNKKSYLELAGISSQKLWDKVKNRKTRTKFKFKECYPSYIKFHTPEFQQLFKKVGDTLVNLNVKQEFPFIYNSTQYTIAKGGGHSCESARIIESDNEWMIYDGDVGSMYPNIIRKRGLYPAHLGPKWNEAYISNINKRLDAKKRYKETGDKKWDNLQETYKLVLNGSFGKLIDRTNWQYDPFIGMCVTIGGQVDIFMLAEQLEMAGIHVISLNTDGLSVYMKRTQLDEYNNICKNWEIQVGNDKLGQLEYVEYEKLVQLSVNDYLAVKVEDKPIENRLKKKGDFLTSYELHKNKSKRIIPVALEAYLTKEVSPEETVRSHKNIYDFGIVKKASKDYYYKSIDKSTGKEIIYNRLIRYYASKDLGGKLVKCKHDHSEKPGPLISQCESSSSRQVVFNRKIETTDLEPLKIDYDWYIEQTYRLIDKLDPEKARLRKEKNNGVLTLF